MEAIDMFKVVIAIMLFYSGAITMITYSVPDDAKQYVSGFSDISEDININSVGTQIQNSVETQTDIPVVEIGALVFYSGNILIDLILNFIFAIPEMIGMLINGIMLLVGIDSYLFAVVETIMAVTFLVFYLIGVIQMLVGIRSGRIV